MSQNAEAMLKGGTKMGKSQEEDENLA